MRRASGRRFLSMADTVVVGDWLRANLEQYTGRILDLPELVEKETGISVGYIRLNQICQAFCGVSATGVTAQRRPSVESIERKIRVLQDKVAKLRKTASGRLATTRPTDVCPS